MCAGPWGPCHSEVQSEQVSGVFCRTTTQAAWAQGMVEGALGMRWMRPPTGGYSWLEKLEGRHGCGDTRRAFRGHYAWDLFLFQDSKTDPRERCALLPFLSSNRLFLMQAWIYTQHKMKTGKTNLCPSQWTGLIHFGGGEVKSLHHFWGPPKYKCNTAVGAPRALLGGHTSMSPEAPDLPVNLRLTSDVHLGKLVYHGRMEAAPGWEPGPAFLWDLCPELWFSNRIHRRPLLILYLNYPQ